MCTIICVACLHARHSYYFRNSKTLANIVVNLKYIIKDKTILLYQKHLSVLKMLKVILRSYPSNILLDVLPAEPVPHIVLGVISYDLSTRDQSSEGCGLLFLNRNLGYFCS